MFKFTGWLVVTSLAIYGLIHFAENHIVANKSDGEG